MAITVVLGSFTAALSQLGDPRFRRVMFKGVGLSIALLVAVNFGFFHLISWLGGVAETQDFFGNFSWVLNIFTGTAIAGMLVLSFFLMMPVASLFASIFLDEVAAAVEVRHYSHLPKMANVPFSEGLKDGVNHFGVVVFANVVALVIYAFFPPFALFIFWGLNGFLLGREYFTLAAMRHLGRDGAKRLRNKHGGTIWLAGTLMAMPLSIPLINLVIPILGAATFTHLFHRLEPQSATSG
ncbi:EI24 domain-containing protein [Shimia sp. Alg240-R146]|uniref:EI24 domain-containing protein n=1 Tax=Shimia sp. Alg240-R146 TaxID=2993449 RepID=UPI0022E14BB6|nr:EI24 domain-containing protein [Shimia sp. Alg240-R146]